MQVVPCRGVKAAIEYLERVRAYPDRASSGAPPVPDVVLCDMHLPDGTGFDLLRTVAELSAAQVVTMTAYGDPELHRLARRMGATRSLDKPFTLDQLMGAIGGARPL
jgi:CheY-like chemotaxis protein